MFLEEFKNEDAVELLADAMEPASVIFGDKEMRTALQNGKSYAACFRIALKNHKTEVVELLAALHGQSFEEYTQAGLCTPIRILSDGLAVLNDKDLRTFFISQVKQMTTNESSTLPAENTEEKEQ